MKKLFLDDDKNPGNAHAGELLFYIDTEEADEGLDSERVDKSFKVVRILEDFDDYLEEEGCPDFISFDYWLTMGDTAMTAVKLLIKRDRKSGGKFIPEGFDFICHSSDPYGQVELTGFLNDYLKRRKNK